MTIDTGTLLQGPRGRRLCLQYALSCAGPEVVSTLGWAIHGRGDHGTSTAMYVGDPPPEPFAAPVVTTEEAASVLDAIALTEPTAASLRTALSDAVDSAMYWQPPDGADRLAAEPEMRRSLARVAGVIATSPHARWWSSAAALGDQWAVPWEGGATSQGDAHAVLATWRAETDADELRSVEMQAADPRADWSGTWWSTPPAGLVHSTRRLGDDGPAGLWFVEDSFGWTSAIATPVLPASARVYEIDGPDAWADLCRRHPLVVTASRRHDWLRVTGRDGIWVQPDWASVAREVDGVHLTVSGYLTAATRSIDLGDGSASVLAGWAPDETYWFGRTLVGGESEAWEADDSGPDRTWRRG